MKLSKEQRDYLLLHPERAAEVQKKIEKHGKDYDPFTDWWPNKYPDM